MSEIAANWARVRDSVVAAAERAGRDPDGVRIVVASKTKSVALIEDAIAAGATDFGENYVQEAADKIAAIGDRVRWHLIGHLQRNKAARAAQLFDCIQTVDTPALAAALARQLQGSDRTLSVMIEVNIGGEASKSGVPAASAAALLAAIGSHPRLRVDGLMTIPPAGDSEAARPYFRQLRELRDRLREGAPDNAPLAELSMGMSDDYRVAIEEGATMVRIGRAVLGERP